MEACINKNETLVNNSLIVIKNDKKMDASISIIRMISLIMIISCHIFQWLGYEAAFWINLGVQIFFFISGFLYGKKNIKSPIDFYKDKVKKILLPYMLLVIIMIIVEKVFIKTSYRKQFLFGTLIGFQGFYGTLNTLSHTWFVSYILICYLLTPILQKICEKNKNITKTLVVAAIFIQLAQYYRLTNIIAPWIINYIIGYAYSAYYNKEVKRERIFSGIIIGLAIVTLPFRIILQYNLINIDVPGIILENKELICQYSHVLIGCSLFIMFYKLFKKMKFIKHNIILKIFDKYSYFIYLTHQIFILKEFSLMNLTDFLFVNVLVIFLVSVLSGISLYYIYRLFIKFMGKLENIYAKVIGLANI